jgi:membrane-bound lytic murein transglycosylase D
MKTMLKTKLSKASLWSHGLLLVVSPAGFNSGLKHSETIDGHVPEQMRTRELNFSPDTMVLSTEDSLKLGLKNLPDSLSSMAPRIHMNPAAVKFVKSYIRRNNEDLQSVKMKSEPYFKIIESVFRKYGLPVELKYLAVIESDLNAHARSRVGARGPWQLMPSTARDMGLKVNRKVDERTYYYKSTVAAAKYIRSLYSEFGDWLLVIAAYNGGNGTVERAIHRTGSRNFWKLQNHLPLETRTHVKRFIGTHYFFEDGGSVTTLTKAEVMEHQKAFDDFMKLNQDINDSKTKVYAGPDSEHNTTDKAIAIAGISNLKKKDK